MLKDKIEKLKKEKDVVILAHNYQIPEVQDVADFVGDSLGLARQAAETNHKTILFCGVHFMAETADILSADNQKTILPNLTAGCSMADMAREDDVWDCWDDLDQVLGSDDKIIPITYMNSTAAIKALCGRNDGIVCTSSNASAAFEWALNRGNKILFLPDQHLGRNTGLSMNIPESKMVVWNPFKALGGHTTAQIKDSKLVLWQGHCSVHTRFTVAQINEARSKFPDVHIVVHPECTQDVVKAADSYGSTEYIKQIVKDSPAGSVFGIGTEISMVNHLAKEHEDKTIFCLDSVVCPCSTMYRIHPAYILWVLEGLTEGVVVNQIKVDSDVAAHARVALDRMLGLPK